MSTPVIHAQQHLPVQLLEPNPFQPRNKVKKDEIVELVESIKAHGVLEPIVVAQTPAGYQIIAGERRWRAAQEAGLTEVPVVIKKTTPKGMLEMALVENVQRVDLSALERAQAFFQLMGEFYYKPAEIAKKIGKSLSYVSNTLRLLDLPDAIKDGLTSGQISEGHARAIGGIEDEKLMVECYKIILKENASVRRAEELARLYNNRQTGDRADKGRPLYIPDAEIAKWQKKFTSLFQTKSSFKLIRSNRQTRISITLHGGPEQTQVDLEKILAFADKGPQ